MNVMRFAVASCFNSRAREGRDKETPANETNEDSFNSRAREGRDESPLDRLDADPEVSIHAPARGATK